MALQRQELVVPLGVGMNEGIPRELLPVGQLRKIQNGRINKPGQLEKRLGYNLIAGGLGTGLSTGLTTNCQRLLRRNDAELCAVDGANQFFSYVPAQDKWKLRDDAPECQVTSRRTVGNGYQLGDLDCAQIARSANGLYLAVAWWSKTGTDDIFVRVFDEDSGTLISELVISTGAAVCSLPRLIAVGNYFVLAYTAGSPVPVDIDAHYFDTAAPASGWSSAVKIANATAAFPFDIYPLSSTEFVSVHIVNATGAIDLNRWTMPPIALAASSLNIRAGKVASTALGVFVDAVTYVAFYNSTDATVEVKGHNTTTMAQVFAAQVISTPGAVPRCVTVGKKSATEAWVVLDLAPAVGNTPLGFTWRAVSSAGSVASSTTNGQRHFLIASRPFFYANHSYICAYTGEGSIASAPSGQQNDQRAIVVLDLLNAATGGLETCRPVARFAEGEVRAARSGGGLNCVYTPIVNTTDGNVYIPFVLLDPSEATPVASDGRGTGVDLVTVRFPIGDQTDTNWSGWCEFNTNTFVPGGLAHQYDGDAVREFGFVYYPWIDQISLVAGGTLTAGTLYEYCVCYVVMDNCGRIWRSRPSIIASATPTGATLSILLRIPYYTATSHEDSSSLGNNNPIGIEIYRRAAASDPFVRLKNSSTTVVAEPNDKSSVTFLNVTDTGGSHTTTDQPNLYTTGGVLEAFTPPPCTQAVIFDNRLWIFNGNTLWYSREILAAEGPAFHPAQTIEVGDEAAITALAVMDAGLVIFKAESVFSMQGVGPDDTGANPGYNVPQRVMTAVGCIDVRSMVTGSKGIYFQSRRGIELLNRSFAVEWIGERVQDSHGATPTVTSSVYLQSDAELRFNVMGGSQTVSSLVYSEITDVWTVDCFHSLTAPTAPISAVSVAGTYYWLEDNSVRVYKEVAGLYSDKAYSGGIVDTWITLRVETGDIIINNPVGEVDWWRSMLFGRRMGSHDLTVEIALSQADTYASPAKAFSIATIATWMSIPIEVAELLPSGSSQRARAIRFRISDVTADTPTRGPLLYSLSLEYGVEGGNARVPVGQRK